MDGHARHRRVSRHAGRHPLFSRASLGCGARVVPRAGTLGARPNHAAHRSTAAQPRFERLVRADGDATLARVRCGTIENAVVRRLAHRSSHRYVAESAVRACFDSSVQLTHRCGTSRPRALNDFGIVPRPTPVKPPAQSNTPPRPASPC